MQGEPPVGLPNVVCEQVAKTRQVFRWLPCLELDDVEHEFVGPGDLSELDLRHTPPGCRLEQAIAQRTNSQIGRVHDSVLDFDAYHVEQVPRVMCHRDVLVPCPASSRLRNTWMIVSYSEPLRYVSSTPASIDGLSLTSTT